MTESKSFFTTLPGILTGLAALITASGGLIYTLDEAGVLEALGKQKPRVTQRGGATPGENGQGQAATETTDGWAIIGKAKGGRFFDLKLMIHGDAPAIGGRYDVASDFRLVAKGPQEERSKGQVITLGRVRRGDTVEVLDLFVKTPSSKRVPVYAKLRAKIRKAGP